MTTNYQDRVVFERDDLKTKVDKLLSFIGSDIYSTVAIAEQRRLDKQYGYMCDYLGVLNERINNFNTTGE
jgi:hypothetical protein